MVKKSFRQSLIKARIKHTFPSRMCDSAMTFEILLQVSLNRQCTYICNIHTQFDKNSHRNAPFDLIAMELATTVLCTI